MSFWDKKGMNNQQVQTQEVVLDEQAMTELQEGSPTDVFEEEEEDFSVLMSDASLRLEMGRLYQMILQGDLFDNINADPRAVKNVQREIRKIVKEKMEVMLGIRQESIKETIVSSPFNDMEITVLKMLASKMSKGATESPQPPLQSVAPTPKKEGITPITNNRAPVKPIPKPLAKAPAKQPVKAQSQISALLESHLTKPIEEMTPEELQKYEQEAAERRAKNKSALPTNMMPHPSPQQLEMMYTMQSASMLAPGGIVERKMFNK